MKIIVLHGDNTLVSYNRLQTFIKVAKKRGWGVRTVSDNPESFSEAITSTGLFEKEKIIVVEDAKVIGKSLKWLKANSGKYDSTLIIYNKGTLSKTFLKSLPGPVKIEEFELPKLIWSFLDSFYPGNAKVAIKLLHDITKKDPVEFVFSLLAKQLRDLYWVKKDANSIPYPSWRVGKLSRQSDKFKGDKLKEIVAELANADIKSKTSEANLIDELDFLLATKLE